MSGNERTKIPLSFGDQIPDLKTGYRIHGDDNLIFVNEFQNSADEEQWIWLALDYEYYDGAQPDSKTTKMGWMQIGPSHCAPNATNPFGASNLTSGAVPSSPKLSEHSFPWIAPSDGLVLAAGGHLHNGGTTLDIYMNEEMICSSEAKYGGKGEAGGSGMNGKKGDNIAHIVGMSPCVPMRRAKRGDQFWTWRIIILGCMKGESSSSFPSFSLPFPVALGGSLAVKELRFN